MTTSSRPEVRRCDLWTQRTFYWMTPSRASTPAPHLGHACTTIIRVSIITPVLRPGSPGGPCHSADEPWHLAPILSGRAAKGGALAGQAAADGGTDPAGAAGDEGHAAPEFVADAVAVLSLWVMSRTVGVVVMVGSSR